MGWIIGRWGRVGSVNWDCKVCLLADAQKIYVEVWICACS
jgi:hypothetical protein